MDGFFKIISIYSTTLVQPISLQTNENSCRFKSFLGIELGLLD